MRMGCQRHDPVALPGKRPDTHFTGGWVGPRACLDACGKSRPHGIRSQERPARSEWLYRLRCLMSNLPQIKAKYENNSGVIYQT
jgi:hypothetical protein